MTHDDSQIADRVVSTAERLEDTESLDIDDLDPLEVKVEAGLDGQIREITAVLGTGGPHIEVAMYAGRVDGYWGGSEHSVPILDDETDEMLTHLAQIHYEQHWEDVVLA